jgi:hypothetical protein
MRLDPAQNTVGEEGEVAVIEGGASDRHHSDIKNS